MSVGMWNSNMLDNDVNRSGQTKKGTSSSKYSLGKQEETSCHQGQRLPVMSYSVFCKLLILLFLPTNIQIKDA